MTGAESEFAPLIIVGKFSSFSLPLSEVFLSRISLHVLSREKHKEMRVNEVEEGR